MPQYRSGRVAEAEEQLCSNNNIMLPGTRVPGYTTCRQSVPCPNPDTLPFPKHFKPTTATRTSRLLLEAFPIVKKSCLPKHVHSRSLPRLLLLPAATPTYSATLLLCHSGALLFLSTKSTTLVLTYTYTYALRLYSIPGM